MTDAKTIWGILQRHLPRRTWIPLAEIFSTVEVHVVLDEEDKASGGSRSGRPMWKSNVQRLLRIQERAGTIRARKPLRDRSKQ
jgi:hypothetical protein